jgi:hypothetical protein
VTSDAASAVLPAKPQPKPSSVAKGNDVSAATAATAAPANVAAQVIVRNTSMSPAPLVKSPSKTMKPIYNAFFEVIVFWFIDIIDSLTLFYRRWKVLKI